MHYVNKVKAYFNFHINHLKLLKNKVESKLYSQMNNVMNITTMNNIDHQLMQQATCKLKSPNVVEMLSNRTIITMCGGRNNMISSYA
jgi:hypothetical protein